MEEAIKAHAKPIRLFFFWAGIIATLSYRIIIVLNFYSPVWVKIAWYMGTIGFIIYFWHRFDIQKKRAELVLDYKLIEAVESIKHLEKKQKQALHYTVKTTLTSKARWNSLFIFLLSVVALLVGIVMDTIQML
ncbi:hypothetical protein MYX07_03895 [Patescibacteria group bacterium AH-259-L07]|nr:hypothetical protein [Patescibacteria group bacterium AH-259-L07]